jgi:hypothetical protein
VSDLDLVADTALVFELNPANKTRLFEQDGRSHWQEVSFKNSAEETLATERFTQDGIEAVL